MLNLLWILAMFAFTLPDQPGASAPPPDSAPAQPPASTPAPLASPAAGPATPATATGFLYKTLVMDGQTYAYCVYVPPDYTPDRPWPVILFLHGAGERGEDGFLQTEIGIGRAIRRQCHRIPAVVVMPQCRPEQAWTGVMAAMALRCVEATSREYHLDPRRIYLTGLSLGGHGAWLLAANYPDRFAAVVPICGFAEYGESTGLAARIAPQLVETPIWCFHGEADKAVPVQKSREIVAAVRAAGGTKIRYTEWPEVAHNAWDRAYDDPDLWKWLFVQQRADK